MSNELYKEFIKRYFKEQGITYTKWSEIQPLYLRYRGRCVKLRPETYEQFKNLCLFESRRHLKYDDSGNLKEGETAGWSKSEQKRNYAGAFYTGQRARVNYKLNYKAPPKKEDFEFAMEWRKAYQDWSYLKDQLADYEAVKAILNRPASKRKPDLIPNENGDMKRYHYMFEYPFLIRYALRCLSGEYPVECFPDALTEVKGELQELLNKQRKVLEEEPVDFEFEVKKWIAAQ